MLRSRLLALSVLTLMAGPGAGLAQPCPPDSVQLNRAVFTTAVVNREPVSAPETLAAEMDVYFFSEIVAGSGKTVVHRWFLDGAQIAAVPLRVGSDRWRTWSRVGAERLQPGRLAVSVELDDGCPLGRQEIMVAGKADAPGTAVAAPAATAPQQGDERSAQDLYQEALTMKSLERFEEARSLLLLAQQRAEADMASRIRDELRYHLPLAEARVHMREKNIPGLREVLPPVREYLRDHPDRQARTRVLDNYFNALWMLEHGD